MNQTTQAQNSQRKLLMSLLFGISIGLVGCQPPNDSSGISTRGGSNAQSQAAGAGVQLVGAVEADPSEQSAFQNSVAAFVDAIMDDADLGTVNAQASSTNGVLLGGRITLASGTLQNYQAQGSINSSSVVYVAIYDSWTGQRDSSGNVIPPIGRYFNQASGYISGTTASLTLSDGNGSIQMQGTIQGTTFEGTFSFNNTHSFQTGQGGESGTLGTFIIPTCQFFACN